MGQRADERFCPVCGRTIYSLYCPDDGAVTVVRDDASSARLPLEIGDRVSNRYEITEVIGRGGFGAVYAARHLVSEQQLAIKILLSRPAGSAEEAEQRFHKEARVLARLNHPNTVRVYDVGYTADGDLFVAMELLRGPNLEQVLAEMHARGLAMTEPQILDVAVPVLGSLAEAHDLDLVHRDMKPANIVLMNVPEEPFMVKVLDFGIVRTQDSNLTRNRAALGTPAYMSPEQCRTNQVDGRSDLYSLGVILFEAVCESAPFHARNAVETMYQQMESPLPDIREHARVPITDEYVAICNRALAKDPDERFANAREMRAALQALRRQHWGSTPMARLDDLVSPRALRGPSAMWRVVVGQESELLKKTTAGPRVGTGAGVGRAYQDSGSEHSEPVVTGLAVGRDGRIQRPSDSTEHGLPSFDRPANQTRTGPRVAPPGRSDPGPAEPADADNAGEFAAVWSAPTPAQAPVRDKPASQMAVQMPSRDTIERALRQQEKRQALEAAQAVQGPTVRELDPGAERGPHAPQKAPRGKPGPKRRQPQMAPPSAADERPERKLPMLGKGTLIGTGLPPSNLDHLRGNPADDDAAT